jgi:hypothetical protein
VLALDGPGCKPFRTRIPTCSIAASPTAQRTFNRGAQWVEPAQDEPSDERLSMPPIARWLMIEWTGWCVTTTRSRPADTRGQW